MLEALARPLQLDDAERAHLFDLARAAGPTTPARRRRSGRALFSELYVNPARPGSTARFVFLDPRARGFYADWNRAAGETEAARDPDDRDLSDLVGELSTKSEKFRTLWAAHNVRLHNSGVKQLHHPVVGDLSLNCNGLELAGDPGLTIFVYTAEPGSNSAESLNLLTSCAATVEPGAGRSLIRG